MERPTTTAGLPRRHGALRGSRRPPRRHRVAIVLGAALGLGLGVGCGEARCPEGTREVDGRCLDAPHDASVDASLDAALDAAPEPEGGADRPDAAPDASRAEADACAPSSERCDGLDDDCDGAIDEGALTAFHPDRDGDGHGDGRLTVDACVAPEGHVPLGGDCDDACAACHPGASEVCEGLDGDCDGTIDEGVTVTRYVDLDRDGVGGAAVARCPGTPDAVDVGGDCDDLDASARPGLPERCDGADNDCSGTADEPYACVRGATLACVTACGSEGAGACSPSCALPVGASCVAPAETCNAHDDDCDGQVDEALLAFGATWRLPTSADDRLDLVGTAEGFVSVYGTPAGLFAQRHDATGARLGTPALLGASASQVSVAAVDGLVVVATLRAGVIGGVVLRASDLGAVASMASLLPAAVFASRVRVVASGSSALFLYHDGARVRAAPRALPGLTGTAPSVAVTGDCAVEFDAAPDADGTRVLVASTLSAVGGDLVVTPLAWSGAAAGAALRVTNDADPQRLPAIAVLSRPDGARRVGVVYVDDVAAPGAPDPVGFANLEVARDGTLRVRDLLRLSSASPAALTGGGASLDAAAVADHFAAAFLAPSGASSRVVVHDVIEPPGAAATSVSTTVTDSLGSHAGLASASGPRGALALAASGPMMTLVVRACR